MKEREETIDCGVIIGRFNIHKLHDAHLDLIKSVVDRHQRVIVFLGNSPLRNTLKNPLDFRERKALINETFPNIEIHYINDCRDDIEWSKSLDKLINQLLIPNQTVVLYGGRDSFINSYKGKFKTIELESTSYVSASEVRKQVANFYPPTADYRAGKIAATAHRYPVCYQTVDVAVVREEKKAIEILLARKPMEKLFRFIGGFSDVKSESLEEDARREVQEESNVEVSDLKYIGSMLVKDWRYEKEIDKIKTAMFVAYYQYGRPEGADDVAEVQWFDLKKLTENDVVEEHRPLLTVFQNYLLGKTEKRKKDKNEIETVDYPIDEVRQ